MVKFYVTWNGQNGHKHHGVATYDRFTGVVTYPSDYIFERSSKKEFT